MSFKRLIATVLTVVMVFGLFAAFPQIVPVITVKAATENLALTATYRGDSATCTNGTVNYGDGSSWTEYHTGKLNDKTIGDSATSTSSNTVEFGCGTGFTALKSGTSTIYFKLAAESSIESVNIYANRRASGQYRGYPDAIRVYVGSSETDISTSTLLGSVDENTYTTYSSDGYVRLYTVSGTAKSGSYVIIQFDCSTTSNSTTDGKGAHAATEIQIMGNAAVAATLSNVAPAATYRGDSATCTNGTSNYGDGSSWTEYHTGKLNDKTIGDSATSTSSNTVEFGCGTGFTALKSGTSTIYFKLAAEYSVESVNIYANRRASGQYRGYPDAIRVYVGSSETDISTSTLLGSVDENTYTTYSSDGYVRLYTVSGTAKSGSYVIIQFDCSTTSNSTTDGKGVHAATEIEIYASTPALYAPVLVGSTGRATYTVPTVTWDAVENATAYDIYLNDTLVVSNTTTRSYTPDGLSPFNLYSYGSNRTCETVKVIAKDSSGNVSEAGTFEFLYVPMPTDRNGNEISTADFIIDPGHGGSDPGAMYETREEADDNLNMALTVGKLLEDAGFTVAYTRLTDVFDSVKTKAAKGAAGNFKEYLCFHRNSTAGAVGVEYYYNTAGQSLGSAIEAEFVSDAIWKNRGIKSGSHLGICNGNTIPTVLLELGFINTPSDNTLFDTYYNETAQAVARGAIKYLGYTLGYTGYVDAPASAPVTGSAATVTATAGNYGDSASFDIRGWMLHSYGVQSIEYNVNGDEWIALESFDRSSELTGYTNYPNKANTGYKTTVSTSGWNAGAYTIKVRGTTVWNSTTLYSENFDIATINLTINDTAPTEYTVKFTDIDGNTLSEQSVIDGGTAIAPNAPAVEGYTFSGWADKNGAIVTDFTNVKADATYTATYTINTYTVAFVDKDGTIIGNAQSVQYGASATAPNAPAVEGYTFSGWADKNGAIVTDFTNVKADATYTATYTINTYTVTFVTSGNGTLTGETSATVAHGTELTDIAYPTALADIGYKFDGWNITTGTVKKAVTITASFSYDASQWFTVRYIVPDSGETDDTVTFGPFVTGTLWADTDITAPTVTGKKLYTFSGWDKEAPKAITEDITFTAIMVLSGNATITFTCDANGTILHTENGTAVTGQYSLTVAAGSLASDVLTFPTALANDGYVFAGWYVNDELYDGNTVIDDNITITAVFKKCDVAIIDSEIQAGTETHSITLTVQAATADFAKYMYVFTQTESGRTYITVNSFTANETASVGVYEVTLAVQASLTASVDVFFTDELIDFAADDWGVTTFITAIQVN